MGRPSSYNEAIADAICERLMDGESLRKICADEHMPSKVTVLRWLKNREEFRTQYAGAREAQMEAMADEILDIADDTSEDTRTIMRGGLEVEVQNAEWINRCRLQVDARKWLMSKLAPKKYGDKVEQFISGPEGGPIQSAITVQFVKTDAPSQS